MKRPIKLLSRSIILLIVTLQVSCQTGPKTAGYGASYKPTSRRGDLSEPDSNGIRHQLPRQRPMLEEEIRIDQERRAKLKN